MPSCPGPARTTGCSAPASLPPEVHEHPPEVVLVLLHAVVERLDLLLLQKPQHALLELPGPLARDDLHERGLLRHGLVDHRSQRLVDLPAPVVDVVQVEFELHAVQPATRTPRIRPVDDRTEPPA